MSFPASPISGPLYEQYLYSYPHKLAYGPINPALPLAEVWGTERKDTLSLYVHVPFCEQRCGFCNLFTFANPSETLPARYLRTLRRQMARTRAALGKARFAQFAVGGGTPTFLSADQLRELFQGLAEVMGLDAAAAPGSVETSPLTATADKLRVLRDRGVNRISMGVQSFADAESASIGRRQAAATVHEAVRRIRDHAFPTLNLDLMYGLPDQTKVSFLASLRAALEHRPEELYLYPLYVRPLTRLGRSAEPSAHDWDAQRLTLYRAGRALLLAEGYTQASMRMFRRAGAPSLTSLHRCQADGMVGLGAGARSYTDAVHYSTAYAVGAQKVRSILESYVVADDSSFDHVSWGAVLTEEEKRRRFAILSLLHESGLDLEAYRARFASDPLADLPELQALLSIRTTEPLLERTGDNLVLTASGFERSDQLGPWLMSERVRKLTREGPRS